MLSLIDVKLSPQCTNKKYLISLSCHTRSSTVVVIRYNQLFVDESLVIYGIKILRAKLMHERVYHVNILWYYWCVVIIIFKNHVKKAEKNWEGWIINSNAIEAYRKHMHTFEEDGFMFWIFSFTEIWQNGKASLWVGW